MMTFAIFIVCVLSGGPSVGGRQGPTAPAGAQPGVPVAAAVRR